MHKDKSVIILVLFYLWQQLGKDAVENSKLLFDEEPVVLCHVFLERIKQLQTNRYIIGAKRVKVY